jgi:hypothetical protein
MLIPSESSRIVGDDSLGFWEPPSDLPGFKTWNIKLKNPKNKKTLAEQIPARVSNPNK